MQRQVLVFKDIVHGGYVVMVCCVDGTEVSDIKTYEKIDRYETIDDVRKMAEALNDILENYGGENETSQ